MTNRYQVGDAAVVMGHCEHVLAKSKAECWHRASSIRRVFSNGRLLLENANGWVAAFDRQQVKVGGKL